MSEIKIDQLGHKSELKRGLKSRHITMISLGGTILATLVTILLASFTKSSVYGISATAAVFHGFGQVIVVSILYNTVQMMWYVFILSISGVITGLLMAFVTTMLIKKLPKQLIK